METYLLSDAPHLLLAAPPESASVDRRRWRRQAGSLIIVVSGIYLLEWGKINAISSGARLTAATCGVVAAYAFECAFHNNRLLLEQLAE